MGAGVGWAPGALCFMFYVRSMFVGSTYLLTSKRASKRALDFFFPLFFSFPFFFLVNSIACISSASRE